MRSEYFLTSRSDDMQFTWLPPSFQLKFNANFKQFLSLELPKPISNKFFHIFNFFFEIALSKQHQPQNGKKNENNTEINMRPFYKNHTKSKNQKTKINFSQLTTKRKRKAFLKCLLQKQNKFLNTKQKKDKFFYGIFRPNKKGNTPKKNTQNRNVYLKCYLKKSFNYFHF